MKKYELKQPEKNKQQLGYWVSVALLSGFMLWIVLINPLMTWPFDRPGEISRLGYGLLTGGAIVAALLALIPFIREDNRFLYTLSLLWANRNYVTHDEWMELSGEHKSKMLTGNSPYVQEKLQTLVDSHDGKDMRVKQYHLKPEYADNLKPCQESK